MEVIQWCVEQLQRSNKSVTSIRGRDNTDQYAKEPKVWGVFMCYLSRGISNAINPSEMSVSSGYTKKSCENVLRSMFEAGLITYRMGLAGQDKKVRYYYK